MRALLWITSCVMCAALGYGAAHVRMSMPEPPPDVAAEPATMAPPATEPAPPALVEPEITAQPEAPQKHGYRLVGIIGTGPDSATLHALIDVPPAGVKRYGENAELPDGARVTAITPRSAVVQAGGERIELRLISDKPKSRQPTAHVESAEGPQLQPDAGSTPEQDRALPMQ